MGRNKTYERNSSANGYAYADQNGNSDQNNELNPFYGYAYLLRIFLTNRKGIQFFTQMQKANNQDRRRPSRVMA